MFYHKVKVSLAALLILGAAVCMYGGRSWVLHWTRQSEAADRAIQRDPNNVSAYVRRGEAKYFPKEHSEAMKDPDKAIELDPGTTEAFELRALANDALGNKVIGERDRAIQNR